MRGGRRKRKEKEGWYEKQVYKNGDKREKGKKIKRERQNERKKKQLLFLTGKTRDKRDEQLAV